MSRLKPDMLSAVSTRVAAVTQRSAFYVSGIRERKWRIIAEPLYGSDNGWGGRNHTRIFYDTIVKIMRLNFVICKSQDILF